MTDLNHVVLIGRITQDIGSDERNFSYVGNGQARANISIAVNRSKKQGDQWVDEVNYFNITVWGKTAENLKPYFNKGQQICVEGHLKQDRWEKDGKKESRISIVADSIQLVGGKKDGDNNASSGNQHPKFQAVNNNAPDCGYTPNPNNDFSEDIPF